MNKTTMKWIMYAAITAGVIAALMFDGGYFNKPTLPEAFASGNGRIEATEVDIATKLPGRLSEISVREGDMVKASQVLARFDTNELKARLKLAEAQVEQARQNKNYAVAIVAQRKSELALAQKNLERSKSLYVNKNISLVQLQQHETAVQTAKAAVSAVEAQVLSAGDAIKAAIAQTETIKVNLDDCVLRAPINGRVLYRLAEAGEVLGSGGKVLTLLELTDVYMTIFLPMAQAGRVNLGAQARIVLDALPDVAIPAKVSFVSPQSQFTPKAVETRTEREKLMFRIKVKIDPELLKAHLEKVKTGLPGVAYIRLDESAPWPPELNGLPNHAPQRAAEK